MNTADSSTPAGTTTATDGAQNPVIWADVPDPSIIRVGDTYYMSSTTMHFTPGVPIMKSDDLVGHVLERPSQLKLAGLGSTSL